MQVDSKDTLAGLPILALRKFFRRGGGGWKPSYLAEKLGLSNEEAEQVVEVLSKQGYVKPTPTGFWEMTEKAKRLSLATAAPPVLRSTAERHLKGLLQRAEQVNADPYFLYYVSEVRVFGSFLTDCPRLGDLDVAVKLEPKDRDEQRHELACEQRTESAWQAGRDFNTIVEAAVWPETEVFRYLKNRSRTISLHPMSDSVLKKTRSEVVFSSPDPHVPESGVFS